VGPARCAGSTPTVSNSKTLNQSYSPNMKIVDQLTLSNFREGRPVKVSTDLEIIILKVTDLHGLAKLFSRTLTGFLRVQTSEFEMPAME
jgi:hypothetical protein